MEAYLKEIGYDSARRTGQVSGGCISQGEVFITDRGKLFVKRNPANFSRPMFEGEQASLAAIAATRTVRVPQPVVVADNPDGPGSILVMEHLDMKYLRDQAGLGRDLARLHLHNRQRDATALLNTSPDDSTLVRVHQFGFDTATYCGSSRQSNNWQSSWSDFYTTKLQEQVTQLNDPELQPLWQQLKSKLPSFFTGLNIEPSLVHGDLWSGNAAQCAQQPVIFDAGSFYGHDEYDLGIAAMFGGFRDEFYTAYHELIPKLPGFENRNQLYQLFHHFNHWNLFGSGYRASSLRIMKKLIRL